jgi:hypothetical protein
VVAIVSRAASAVKVVIEASHGFGAEQRKGFLEDWMIHLSAKLRLSGDSFHTIETVRHLVDLRALSEPRVQPGPRCRYLLDPSRRVFESEIWPEDEDECSCDNGDEDYNDDVEGIVDECWGRLRRSSRLLGVLGRH